MTENLKFRPEFGNPDHIKILEKERKEKEEEAYYRKRVEKELGVGTISIEGCGKCGTPTDESEYHRQIDGRGYRFCAECGSLIDSYSIKK